MSKFHSANISVKAKSYAGGDAEVIGTGYKLFLGAKTSIQPIAIFNYKVGYSPTDNFVVQWDVSGTMYTIK